MSVLRLPSQCRQCALRAWLGRISAASRRTALPFLFQTSPFSSGGQSQASKTNFFRWRAMQRQRAGIEEKLRSQSDPAFQRDVTLELRGTVVRTVFHNAATGFTVFYVHLLAESAAGEDASPNAPSRTKTKTKAAGKPVAKARDSVSVVATLPSTFAVGQTLRVLGRWVENSRFGPEFEAEKVEEVAPQDQSSVEALLGRGLLPGIGPMMARRLVQHFGADRVLDVLDHASERLLEIEGIGAVKLDRIRRAWTQHAGLRRTIEMLQQHNIPPPLGTRLYRIYGESLEPLLRENPYRLISDVHGLGFVAADRIAQRAGLSTTSPQRIESAVVHVLQRGLLNGDCFLPHDQILRNSIRLLAEGLPEAAAPSDAELRPMVLTAIDSMLEQSKLTAYRMNSSSSGDVSAQQILFALSPVEDLEQTVCRHVERLLAEQQHSDGESPAEAEVRAWLNSEASSDHVKQLSPEQRDAVVLALTRRLCVVTGGPGCGKTFVLRAVVDGWLRYGLKPLLLSPTGRGAFKLAQITGQPAMTVHRALEYDRGAGGAEASAGLERALSDQQLLSSTLLGLSFRHHERRPLPYAAVVLDEASMLDLPLLSCLLRALPRRGRLLLVGDSDQLPSVGPGSVLRDMIRCGRVPVAVLSRVFRQAALSDIIGNAHRVNQGLSPHLEPISLEQLGKESYAPKSECLWLPTESATHIISSLSDVLRVLLPRLGFDPVHHTQVLSPMLRGSLGALAINSQIQQLLLEEGKLQSNPTLHVGGGRVFHPGDRVMQLVNDYERDVFNGDTGSVVHVDPTHRKLLVRFENRSQDVQYEGSQLDELGLAWAISVHKSQGSEYDAVVLLLFPSHSVMLSRHVLYTALTRGKKLVVILGPQSAIDMAVKRVWGAGEHRNTLLASKLSAGAPQGTRGEAQLQRVMRLSLPTMREEQKQQQQHEAPILRAGDVFANIRDN